MNSYKIEFLSDPVSIGILALNFEIEDSMLDSLSIHVDSSDTNVTLAEKLSLLIETSEKEISVISRDGATIIIQTPDNIINLFFVSNPNIVNPLITKIPV